MVDNEKGLTLETSAKHPIPQTKNIPYQPLLIKPIFSILPHAKKVFFKTSLPVVDNLAGLVHQFGLVD